MADARIPLVVADEVAAALAGGGAVVALESTIISHGMPWPRNVETALAVEAAVRGEGGVPATIAVVEGVLRVGLDVATLERFGRGTGVGKAGSRDLARAVVLGQTAGTTVSATMRIAAMAGVRVFATGGIGGVHREAEESFDVSADLTELSRTEVAVVCAGAKSILDIPKTLEVLETLRVPVVVLGSDEFPAFYTRESGVRVEDGRLDTEAEVAALIRAHRRLGVGTGVLVANPIPVEAALDGAAIGGAIEAALAEAREAGVVGKAVTPFLLARLNATTGGAALGANVALVLHNARVAARIAVAGV